MLQKSQLNDSFFDNIEGKKLDKSQREIILNMENNLLVVAGAGSGKTLTIIAKIKYLIEKLNYDPREILCISFTNETVNNLKMRSIYDIDCFTFHKLSLNILKNSNISYTIASSDLLDYTVNEYFNSTIYYNELISYVIEFFKYYIKDDFNYNDLLIKYQKLFYRYKKTIISFIKKIKTYGKGIDDIKKYFNIVKNDNDINLLIIIVSIYSLYINELNSTLSIDFDDMICKAAECVKNDKINFKYKYIIIDEYQDISYIRYLLINNIILKTNAKLMCVGDDYQSIYGFSGCNINLFINFSKYYSNTKIMYINRVYRNSYEIINLSTKFIRKNKYQIKKKLIANFSIRKPIILVNFDKDYTKTFYNLLEHMYQNNEKNVLVLTRYNFSIKKLNIEMNNDYILYKDMKIKFLTVHSAKGLEEDNVIILDMIDDILGFPSKIVNEDIFNLIEKNDVFPYAEERRLFYVALTRTKKKVYILTKRNQHSAFLNEICHKVSELIVK